MAPPTTAAVGAAPQPLAAAPAGSDERMAQLRAIKSPAERSKALRADTDLLLRQLRVRETRVAAERKMAAANTATTAAAAAAAVPPKPQQH